MTTQTAYAYREVFSWRNKITILKDASGKVLKTFNGVLNQPRKNNLKQITLNGKQYLINWDNAKNL